MFKCSRFLFSSVNSRTPPRAPKETLGRGLGDETPVSRRGDLSHARLHWLSLFPCHSPVTLSLSHSKLSRPPPKETACSQILFSATTFQEIFIKMSSIWRCHKETSVCWSRHSRTKPVDGPDPCHSASGQHVPISWLNMAQDPQVD